MKKLLAMLLAAAMLTVLGSCSQSDGGNNSPSQSPAQTDLSNMRAIAEEAEDMCGAVYLNYDFQNIEGNVYEHDIATDREYFDNLLQKSPYAEKYAFLTEIPQERRVGTPGGQDLFLIVPTDPQAKVTVDTLELSDEGEPVVKDRIFEHASGEPILLQCNVSDIFPECMVTITDTKGEKLEWSPCVSMRDGTLMTEGANGKSAYDFTVYPVTDGEED